MEMAEATTANYLYVVAALLLPLVLLLLQINKSKSHREEKRGSGKDGAMRLPPGPWRLPVIGSLHHLLGKPLVHRATADLARRLGSPPLLYLKLGEIPVVIATSRDAAREIMRTHDAAFATRPWSTIIRINMADGQGLVFAPYDEVWRQLRKLAVVELLSARRVRSFRRVREEEVARLVAALAASAAASTDDDGEPAPPPPVINVSESLAVLVTDTSFRTMIGDRFDRREEFLDTLEEGIRLGSGFNLCDLFPTWSWLVSLVSAAERRAHANHRRNFELMEYVIRQHRERRGGNATVVDDEDDGRVVVVREEEEEEDLVDVLLRIRKEGGLNGGAPLTMGTIKAVILDLFGAGSETSATTLQWAMSELVRNPGVMNRAQAEIRDALHAGTVTEDDLPRLPYLKLIIKETLRLHPPAPLLIPRESTDHRIVLGYDVPRGTTVLVNAWALGRDPRYWGADAEAFRPERFESSERSAVDFKGADFEFVPFGAGRRMCPGMLSALAGVELALAALLFHFDWEVVPGYEVDMEEEMGLTVRRKNDLYLRPVVRVPPPPSPLQ